MVSYKHHFSRFNLFYFTQILGTAMLFALKYHGKIGCLTHHNLVNNKYNIYIFIKYSIYNLNHNYPI